MSRPATILILAIITLCGVAFAEGKNPHCYMGMLPPMDVIAACDENIDSDPGDAQAYQSRGIAWYRLSYYDEAIDDFTASINIDPKYIKAFFNRALAREQKGKLDDALADLQYYLFLDPSFPDAAFARVTATKQRIEAAARKPPKVAKLAVQPLAAPTGLSTLSAVETTKPLSSAPKSAILQGRKLALVIGNNAIS
jgi:tetratricopeptide (TPR) repeat protein